MPNPHYERLIEMFREDGLSHEYQEELDALVRDLKPEPALDGNEVSAPAKRPT